MAINPASVSSHDNYCSKEGFTFPILSDSERKVAADYDCLKPDGKGILRTVYAINPEGIVIFAERGQADYNQIMELIKSGK